MAVIAYRKASGAGIHAIAGAPSLQNPFDLVPSMRRLTPWDYDLRVNCNQHSNFDASRGDAIIAVHASKGTEGKRSDLQLWLSNGEDCLRGNL